MSSRRLRLALGVTLAGYGLYSLRRAARSRVAWRSAASGAGQHHTSPASQAKPAGSSAANGGVSSSGGQLTVLPAAYPAARRDESVVDVYPGGHSVKDPFRWLENPDSEETAAFVALQNSLTNSVLDQCSLRDPFRQRMTAWYDYEKHGTPRHEGGLYVFSYNSGLQPQSVVYTAAGVEPDAPKRVLLDPNTMSADGTVSLSSTSFTHDGRLCAYGISASGSDWVTAKLLSVDADGGVTHLDDVVQHAKFTGFSWTHDNRGFFYARYPPAAVADQGTEVAANKNHQVWYHTVGSPQSDDVLCFAMPEEPDCILGAHVSDDGKYLFISATEGCDPRNKLFYVDLERLSASGGAVGADMPVVRLVDNYQASWSVVANEGSILTLMTNLDAPRYKLVRVDLDEPEQSTAPQAAWPELVSQAQHVLEWAAAAAGDALILCYLQDAQHRLQLHSLADGSLVRRVPLPIGTVRGCSLRREHSDVFVSFVSFLDPGAVYRFDTAHPEKEDLGLAVVRRSLVAGLDPEEYVTQQVFVPSKDGTQVPMFIVTHRDFVSDGTAPALLYAYGGFSISLTPSFSASKMAFVRSFGGCYAVANLRGGGEYGEEWHQAGQLGKKQNVFDDFCACAQYLVANNYTSPAKLTIEGGSNGGLLVAAVVNQQPQLFGCAIAHVGVHDMLRFHRFTIGHAWVTEYGCADADEAQFKTLMAYSPLHNVARPPGRGQYPAMMLLTADHDDRVVPLHSLKLAATLQHVLCRSAGDSPQRAPLVIRVDVKSGHGAGKPTQKIFDEVADVYGFVARALSLTWRD